MALFLSRRRFKSTSDRCRRLSPRPTDGIQHGAYDVERARAQNHAFAPLLLDHCDRFLQVRAARDVPSSINRCPNRCQCFLPVRLRFLRGGLLIHLEPEQLARCWFCDGARPFRVARREDDLVEGLSATLDELEERDRAERERARARTIGELEKKAFLTTKPNASSPPLVRAIEEQHRGPAGLPVSLLAEPVEAHLHALLRVRPVQKEGNVSDLDALATSRPPSLLQRRSLCGVYACGHVSSCNAPSQHDRDRGVLPLKAALQTKVPARIYD